MSPDELDNMMQRATGLTATSNEFDSAAIADNMTAFVNKLSSHEGAEFPQCVSTRYIVAMVIIISIS